MDNLLVLCDDLGSRFGGTDEERLAAEYLCKEMEAYGLNVHQEPVEYEGWTRGETRLEIIHPIQKTIPCISLPQSPPVELEADIVDLGDGAIQDFECVDRIKNKVVMTTSVVNPGGSSRWIHRGEKYGRSLFAGASGFIFVNHYPAYGPVTGSIGHGREGLIPGISISNEDGAFIHRLIQRKGSVRIRLTSTDSSSPMVSWNVVGDLPGKRDPDQVVMLGCHYDGHDISQGAEDPASGVVALLEAARVLALYAPDLPYTVRFCFWGIEELGLCGSTAYVEKHKNDLAGIRFYLNMDAAGAKSNGRDIVLNEWPVLEPLFKQWAGEMALDYAVGQSTMTFSDHYSFFMAGTPSGNMQSVHRSLKGRGYGHTHYDTVDKVDIKDLREASALAARLALRIASEENWPAVKRDEQIVLDLLDTPDYREETDFRNRFQAYVDEKRKK